MNKTGAAPGDTCSSLGDRPAQLGGIKVARACRSDGAASDFLILHPRCYSAFAANIGQNYENLQILQRSHPWPRF